MYDKDSSQVLEVEQLSLFRSSTPKILLLSYLIIKIKNSNSFTLIRVNNNYYNSSSTSSSSSQSVFYNKSNVSAVSVINQNYSDQNHWASSSQGVVQNKTNITNKFNFLFKNFKNKLIKN